MYTRPRIIPVLSIDNRDLIKTVKFDRPTYLGDPVNAVKIFNRKAIDELSVLDIRATKRGTEPDFELLKDIAGEAFMPLSYGGGIKTVEEIRELLAIGYEKVVLNSTLFRNPGVVKQAVEVFGSQSIVASIDVKTIKNSKKCTISSGSETVGFSPTEAAEYAENLGCGEIIVNSVDRDGTMFGYDIELIKSLSMTVSIPVIACGGAGGITDLKMAIQEGHAHAAAGGSMFVYYGKLKAVLITAPTEQELLDADVYSFKQ